MRSALGIVCVGTGYVWCVRGYAVRVCVGEYVCGWACTSLSTCLFLSVCVFLCLSVCTCVYRHVGRWLSGLVGGECRLVRVKRINIDS